MISEAIRYELVARASKHGLDPALVYGIIMRESGGDPLAVRYEPHYRWVVPNAIRPVNCSFETEHALQRFSWGCMQVMGAVLREYGYAGWLHEIVRRIDEQIEFGCRHLLRQVKRYPGSMASAIAAYNAGNAKKIAGGRFINQPYVDAVTGFMERWDG